MPSDANMTVRAAVPTGLGFGGLTLAAVTGLATAEKSKAVKASRTSGRKRLDDLGTGVLLVRKPASRVPWEGERQHARPPWTGHNDPGAHTITSRKPAVIFRFAVGPRLPRATVPGRTTTLRFGCGPQGLTKGRPGSGQPASA